MNFAEPRPIASNTPADIDAVIACVTVRSIDDSLPATTARVSLPVLPCASFAIACRRLVPGATGTVTANVPSGFTTAATSLTVTLVTAESSIATPLTSIEPTAPANVPRSGDVMWTFGAFGSIAGASGSYALSQPTA